MKNTFTFEDESFGVRYTMEIRGNRVTKEKFFSTEKKLDKFVEKVQEKDGFVAFEAWPGTRT